MSTVPRSRQRLARRLGWLVVATLVAASFAPSVMALSGAIYTSNIDGSIINENTGFAAKSDVYLTGGPCNGGSHLGNGDYYFEVTSPNGVLLSSDSIGSRFFTVNNGFIQTTASHATHAVNCSPPVTGVTVQLIPFDDTPNSGGEYKLTIATASSVQACAGFSASSTTFEICNQADSKSDNFKVGEAVPTATPTVAPTATPTVAPTATPTVAPTATPTVAPTATPTVAPTATPGVPTQFAFPTIALTDCTVIGGQGSIIVSGFAATNGGQLVLNPGAGEIVITANGTYPLAPGTYSAIIRFAGETVAGPTQLVIGACPAATATPAPTGGVGGATATPAPTAATTLPPTDTLGDAAPATGGDSWRIVLLALAGLLTAALLLTPARAYRKDR